MLPNPCDGIGEHRHGAGVVAALLVQGEEVSGGVEQCHRGVGAESETRKWATEPDVGGLRLVEVESREGRAGGAVEVDDMNLLQLVERVGRASAKPPTRVRRSIVRWPPTPSAAPRSRASART